MSVTKKVVVASKNPVKINSVKLAFGRVFKNQKFDILSVSVDSNVADQPMTSEATLQGAKNRANNARSEFPIADYWVGIEAGVMVQNSIHFCFAWVVILSSNQIGLSKSSMFALPHGVSELLVQGIELGQADNLFFNRKNSGQKDGIIGVLTSGKISRTDYYVEPTVLALIPFINQELY